MAKGPGPLLLLGGLGALLFATRKKKDEPLPPPPNGDDGPKPGGDEEEEEGVEHLPEGSTIEPGAHVLGVGLEYVIPFRTGPQPEMYIYKLVGTPGTQHAWDRAVYGPYEDYIFEKETQKDFIIIQFQKAGKYDFDLMQFGKYSIRAV